MDQVRPTLKHSALVVRLEPGLAQRRLFAGAAGARRYAHNWALAKIAENTEIWRAERDAGVDPKKHSRPLSMIDLGKLWRAERETVAPWYAQYPSELYNFAFRDAVAAHRNFLAGRARFPKFKKKSKTPPAFSVCFTARLEPGTLTLSRVGAVKISAPDSHQADLRRRIRRGRSRITSARVYGRRGHWWAALAVESAVRTAQRPASPDGPVVGVDLGLTTQAVVATSDRTVAHIIPGQRHYRVNLAKTQRLSWSAGGPRGSTGYHKARRRLRNHQASIAGRRAEDLHRLTKMLASIYPMVCIEDLFVRGISMSPHLGSATLDQSLGELRRQLSYKAERYESRVVVAARFYPSTKTCARCRAVKAKLPLSLRTYCCEQCDLVIDRDVNAASNLALWGEAVLATEVMAALCGHDTQSGDPDRPGPSATKPRVFGSRVNRSHTSGGTGAGRLDRPAGETGLAEARSSRQFVCT